MKFLARLLLLVLLLSLGIPVIQAQDDVTLTVFAAASLTDAFTELAEGFEAANDGVTVQFSFAGSSDLATQLVEGAPADVFASANARQMTVAREGGRIEGQPRTFVKNRLVLIVPSDNPAEIDSLQDLDDDGVLFVVAAEGVPVRDYTNTLLDKLAAVYGEEFREGVVSNIVSEEENVRQVAAKVALGEADAGIVYVSDVTPEIAGDVIALPILDTYNTLATYPIATVTDSAYPDVAAAFVDYVLSEAGQDVLEAWNFISAEIPEQPDTITLPADGALHVDGQIYNPLTLTADDLQNNYPSQSVDVTYLSGQDTVSSSFTGVLLWDILSNAQVNYNADVHNDKLSFYIVATASDGYQAVVSLAEIDPEFGNQPILVAFAEQGEPIADEEGALRLIVPSDGRGGRYVSGLVSLSVRDAPRLGE